MQQPPTGQGWSQQGQSPYSYGSPSQSLPPNTQYPNTQYPPPYRPPLYNNPGQYQQPYGQPPPQGYPPMMQPPPPPKKKSSGKWIVIGGIILFIILVGSIMNAGKSNNSTATTDTSTTTSQQQATSAPTTPPTPTPTPKPLKWTTVQTFTGSGNKKTSTFSVPGDWKLLWSCPASEVANQLGEYNLMVDVDNSDGTPADLGAINELCKSGNLSGETEERVSGNVYLDITSEAGWTIKIQFLK